MYSIIEKNSTYIVQKRIKRNVKNKILASHRNRELVNIIKNNINAQIPRVVLTPVKINRRKSKKNTDAALDTAKHSHSYAASMDMNKTAASTPSIVNTLNSITEPRCNDSVRSGKFLNQNNTTKSSCDYSESIEKSSDQNNTTKRSCDDSNMYVVSSYEATKKDFCFFCKTMQTSIVRHLENKHHNESDVQKFVAIPKGDKKRIQIIDVIRKNGNYIYNTDPAYNKGELIVCRRPNSRLERTPYDFLPCPICKGFFSKNNIRHHYRICSNGMHKNQRNVLLLGRQIAGRIHKDASDMLALTIFPVLRDDAIVRAIKYDDLLIWYGNSMCIKYAPKHQHHMIRTTLRLSGRLLLAIRGINPNITDFKSIYNPIHYQSFIKAAKIVLGFDERTQTCKSPSTTFLLYSLVDKMGRILIIKHMERNDVEKISLAKDFLIRFKETYYVSVNSVDTGTQSGKEDSNYDHITNSSSDILPDMNEIKKLSNYLKAESSEAYTKLKSGFSYGTWRHLAELTLILTQLSNYHQTSDIEQMTIHDFKKHYPLDKLRNTVFDTLSKELQEHVKTFVYFMISSKHERKVPVLLQPDLFNYIELILSHRKDAEVPDENKYIFGVSSYDNPKYYLKVSVLMGQFAKRCKVNVPATFSGKLLRKQIAKASAALYLSNGEMTDLQTFMEYQKKKDGPELEIINNEENENEDKDNYDDEDPNNDSNKELAGPSDTKQNNCTPLYERRRWDKEEKEIVLRLFREHIKNNELPSFSEIRMAIKKNRCLTNRTVPQIKTWIHNQLGKTKRKRLNARKFEI